MQTKVTPSAANPISIPTTKRGSVYQPFKSSSTGATSTGNSLSNDAYSWRIAFSNVMGFPAVRMKSISHGIPPTVAGKKICGCTVGSTRPWAWVVSATTPTISNPASFKGGNQGGGVTLIFSPKGFSLGKYLIT